MRNNLNEYVISDLAVEVAEVNLKKAQKLAKSLRLDRKNIVTLNYLMEFMSGLDNAFGANKETGCCSGSCGDAEITIKDDLIGN